MTEEQEEGKEEHLTAKVNEKCGYSSKDGKVEGRQRALRRMPYGYRHTSEAVIGDTSHRPSLGDLLAGRGLIATAIVGCIGMVCL